MGKNKEAAASGAPKKPKKKAPSRKKLLRRMERCLIYNKDGATPKSCLPNVVTILRMHPDWKGVLVYDAFAHTTVTTRVPSWNKIDMPDKPEPGEWTDPDTARLVSWLGRMGIHIQPQIVEQAIQVAADAHKINPVQDYFNELKWDGKKRLDRFAVEYLGAIEDNEYAKLVGRKWMIGVVARGMNPGCQVDNTLILESPLQGEKKSSALRALLPIESWFGDTPITIGDKDSYQALRGKLIYALDELDSTRRAEATKTKSFLTSRTDTYRPSYGRRTRDFKRQTVFCGSTNEEFYLPDRTGNRRYWPLRVKAARVQKIIADRDQLWAEAVAAFKNKEQWWDNTTEFKRLCEAEQAERQIPDDWLPLIEDYVRKNDRGWGVHTVDVLKNSELAMHPSQIHTGHTQRCAAVLRELGYVRGPLLQVNGERARRYQLPTPALRNLKRKAFKDREDRRHSDHDDEPDDTKKLQAKLAPKPVQ